MAEIPRPQVQIGLNQSQYAALVEAINPKRAKRAMSAAVRSSMNKMIVMMVKHLGTVLDVDKKGIKGDPSRPTFAKPKRIGELGGLLTINKRAIRAIKFRFVSPRNRLKNQNKKPGGVRINFRPGSGVRVSKAFIGKVKFAGGETKAVLIRTTKKAYPIKQVYGPSVLSLLAPDQLTALGRLMLEKSREIFKTELESKINWVLARKKGDPPIFTLPE